MGFTREATVCGQSGAVGDAPLAGGESLKMDVSGASGGKG